MKTYQYILIGLASFLFFLLLNIPANVAYPYWKQYMGKSVPVELSGVSGSIWDGEASVRVERQQLDQLHWDFSFLSLLMARLNLDWTLQAAGGQGQGTLSKRFGSVALEDVKAEFPVKDLARLFNLESLSADGTLSIDVDALNLEQGFIVSALGKVSWQNAEFAIFKPIKLGSMEVTFEPDENGVKGVLKDKGGPVEADGLLTLSSTGEYKLSASVRVRDTTQKDLVAAVNSIGKTGSDGKIRLNYSGKMPALPI